MPWLFSLDHTNYARWLSVHIRDMANLEQIHPDIFNHFCSGAFVVKKTKRRFSAIALDQAHEQCNALIKGQGGAVGLTNNPGALRRWMIAGPEISRMVQEFEEQFQKAESVEEKHHEEKPTIQSTFAVQVNSVVCTFEEMGNPFAEDSKYLFAVDTKDIMSNEVVNSVYMAYTLGVKQYNQFIDERFVKQSQPISAPIQRNKLPLLSSKKAKPRFGIKGDLAVLKNDCALFSRLYIACQSRSGNIEEFFRHENQPWPPSLSKIGEMRTGTKADLVRCLLMLNQGTVVHNTLALLEDPEFLNTTNEVDSERNIEFEDYFETTDTLLDDTVSVPVREVAPAVQAKVLDGAAIVQMLSPKLTTTFEDYVDKVFLPYLTQQLETAERVDIVWDVYKDSSLKSATRERRGCGLRRRVQPSARIPGNWQGFLRVNENKTELFHYKARRVTEKMRDLQGKICVSTCEENVLAVPHLKDITRLSPCTHEEADTRIFLHVKDCAHEGLRNILIRTTDTDVLILAVMCFQNAAVRELWVGLGVGKHFKYIAAHEIAAKLGPTRSKALSAFHAFTGSDVTSFFSGRGKTTAWNTWAVCPEATEAFLLMMDNSSVIPLNDKITTILERFVVLMYDRTSNANKVDHARQCLFTRGNRQLENIPPTRAALQQHILRATYLCCFIWGQCLVKEPSLPSPEHWGWEKDANEGRRWRPTWTTLPEAQNSCYELIHCGCKQSCRGRCKCIKANLKCTALCACGGDCSKD